MTSPSDEEIDSLIARLEPLFLANVDASFNVAHRVLWNRSDAEDVVQNTFVKAATRLDQLTDVSRARPWLLQIAYREAIALLRKRRETPTDPAALPDGPSHLPGPADIALNSDLARRISDALASMDEGQRIAVVLRDVEELPMREVANVMGVGESAAKMRVSRGREALRHLLREELADAV